MKAFKKTAFILPTLIALVVLTAVQWQGDLSFAFIRARALENSLPEAKMMRSSSGMMSSGGIYFSRVAEPSDNLNISTLGIKYFKSENDGNRLRLVINGNQIRTTIPDWQLIPIAKFADSQYNSCITLSGQLYDEGKAELIIKNGGRIINYHPVFDGTLLGWRLLQMDILLLYPEAVYLPEYDGGGAILGSHEEPFSTDYSKAAYGNMQDYLAELQASLKEKQRSWLISDCQTPVNFKIAGGSLVFESGLYFDCWRFRCDAPDMSNKAENERLDAIRTILRHEFEAEMTRINEGDIDENTYRKEILHNILNLLPDLIDLHATIARQLYKPDQFVQFKNSIHNGNLSALLNGYDTKDLVEIWNTSVQIGAFYEVVHMEDYSVSLSRQLSVISRINPLAYKAAVSTMEYAAFFRFVKKRFPEEWNRFMAAVKDAKTVPAPETPTVIYPKNNSLITHLLN